MMQTISDVYNVYYAVMIKSTQQKKRKKNIVSKLCSIFQACRFRVGPTKTTNSQPTSSYGNCHGPLKCTESCIENLVVE